MNRIGNVCDDDGNRLTRLPGRTCHCFSTRRHDDFNLETDELGGEVGKALRFSLCGSTLDGDISPFEITKVIQTFPECLARRDGRDARVRASQVPDPGNSPRRLRIKQQRDSEQAASE
jgi:hypothetical protein